MGWQGRNDQVVSEGRSDVHHKVFGVFSKMDRCQLVVFVLVNVFNW